MPTKRPGLTPPGETDGVATMVSKGIQAIAVAALGALLLAAPASAKPASTDAQVQMLADFPALRRLAAQDKPKAVRHYLHRVATAYRAAGYDALADALPKADAVIALFAEPKGATTRRELRPARALLRRFEAALARNAKIALPANAGERLPNYYGLAAAFLENAQRALKNIANGKSAAKSLRKAPDTSWVTNVNGSEFSVDGSLPASTTLSCGGTLSLSFSGVNNYLGATTINGGTLNATTINGGTLNVSYSESLSFAGSYGYFYLETSKLSFGTSLNLGEFTGYRWVALPPDVATPDDWSAFTNFTLSSDFMNGTVNLASGTRIVKAPEDLPLPDGAVELPAGMSLLVVPTISTSGTLSFGAFPTPTPSPTPSE